MKNLELSGSMTLFSILTVAFFVISLIYFFRIYFRKKTTENINGNSNDYSIENIITRTKHNNVNVFSWTRPFFFFGLATALATTLLAFSWTTYDKQVVVPFQVETFVDLEITPPPTELKPPPPPPPPPPVIEEVAPEEIEEEDEPEFEDMDVTVDDAIEEPVVEVVEEVKIAPPPPPPLVEEENEIVKFAEQMPRFPGCEDMAGTNKEKQKCAEKLMMEFISKKLIYPNVAKENNIQGRVVLRFVVDQSGTVTDIKVIHDIGGGCGNAAENVVKAMNNLPQKWTPGKQRGRPVKVLYTLPITFRLQ